ncbi:hypothetical protein [Undibacterium sp. Xuan67W]|uniref:hypothetical protein n=1 Tax=Undibacterium sp. Xuan67W TaxID=3413057 RepID=UPI003BF04D0B
MNTQTTIAVIISIFGGWIANLFNIQVMKFFFKEIYESTLEKHGVNGLNFRLAIILLLIDLPGLIQGIVNPQPILSAVCASSAFFALVMLLRNLPKPSSKQLQN